MRKRAADDTPIERHSGRRYHFHNIVFINARSGGAEARKAARYSGYLHKEFDRCPQALPGLGFRQGTNREVIDILAIT